MRKSLPVAPVQRFVVRAAKKRAAWSFGQLRQFAKRCDEPFLVERLSLLENVKDFADYHAPD
jgi:hypothetical protein